MNSTIGVAVVLVGLFFTFYILGAMIIKKIKIELDFCGQVIAGFVVFALAFVVVDIPFEYAGASFNALAYSMLIVWCALIGYSIYFCKGITFPSKDLLADNSVFGMLTIVGAEIWYGMNNAIYTSNMDAAYYNLSSITAIYTNTIFEYEQFSGFFGNANTRAQDSYIMFVAVLSKLSNMHVLVMVNRVMAILEIVLFNILLYEIAMLLTNRNKKIAHFAIPMYAIISLYYWVNGGEALLWGRLAESKSMFANIYIPIVLYCFLVLATQKENKKIWWMIMGAVTVGGALSFSGTYIILGYTFFLVLAYWLMNGRQWKDIGYSVLAVLPGTVLMLIRTLG